VNKNRLDELNDSFRNLSYSERMKCFYELFQDVLVSSSFGTTSSILLKLVNDAKPEQKVHFIDTTFVFRETEAYIETLKESINLDIVRLKPDPYLSSYTHSRETWKSDTDLCCTINKLAPLESIKLNYKVWVSGLISWQNSHRQSKNIFEYKNGMLKFYPIIDITEEQANLFMMINELPEHPLKQLGYDSVGCTHCTIKGRAREGRWQNQSKTECGLHT
jgi:phosphoadenosine phosphosulfate reductase